MATIGHPRLPITARAATPFTVVNSFALSIESSWPVRDQAGANHAVARAREQHAWNERDGAHHAPLILSAVGRGHLHVPDLLALF